MDIGSSQLADTRLAFDSVAASYDAVNAQNVVIRDMRARLWQAVTDVSRPGATLLDLGCGPGPDAVHFARLGYRVVAVDDSLEMVRAAQAAVLEARVQDRVTVRQCRIQDLATLDEGPFDTAYSDLGPLNCVPDLEGAAAALARRLRSGGHAVTSVIGRLCPWEWVRFAAPARWGRAAVRFRRGFVPVPLNAHTVWTRYYLPGEFARPFVHAGFRRRWVQGMGIVLPPPFLDGLAQRHPRAMATLAAVDRQIGRWPLLRTFGDHFLMGFQKD